MVLGYKLTNATRHGELREGAQREGKMTLNLMRYLAASKHIGVADGGRFCGGGVRVPVATMLRWSSGEEEVRLG